MVASEEVLAAKFAEIWPRLNERQRRVVAGAEARSLGWGGVSLVARASGLSIPTVRKAVQELASAEQTEQLLPGGRVSLVEAASEWWYWSQASSKQ